MQDDNNIFVVRPINQECTKFIITIGNHLATNQQFDSKEEAEEYKNGIHWDMIVALVAEMNYEFEKKLKQEKK